MTATTRRPGWSWLWLLTRFSKSRQNLLTRYFFTKFLNNVRYRIWKMEYLWKRQVCNCVKNMYTIYTPFQPTNLPSFLEQSYVFVSVFQCIARCKGIHHSPGFWIPYRGFRIPGAGFWSLSVELGFWLPFVIEISNSLSCIPDSTSKIFPDPLTWGIPAIRGFLIFGDKSKGLCSQGNMGWIVLFTILKVFFWSISVIYLLISIINVSVSHVICHMTV